MVDYLGVVAQSLLGKPLRVTALERPFRPRIPIRMQRYAFDAQRVAPLLELRGPVTRAHRAEVGKQRPCRRPSAALFGRRTGRGQSVRTFS